MEEQGKKSFRAVLRELGIENYCERIMSSSSHGDLFHLWQYFSIADIYRDDTTLREWFPLFFEDAVKMAEETWERPESVYQHIFRILKDANEAR